MVIQVPESIKLFTEYYLKNLGNSKSELLSLYMTGFILCPGKRTFTALGSTVFMDQRHKTTVGKFFHRKTFDSKRILEDLLGKLIREELKLNVMKKEWALLIDLPCKEGWIYKDRECPEIPGKGSWKQGDQHEGTHLCHRSADFARRGSLPRQIQFLYR